MKVILPNYNDLPKNNDVSEWWRHWARFSFSGPMPIYRADDLAPDVCKFRSLKPESLFVFVQHASRNQTTGKAFHFITVKCKLVLFVCFCVLGFCLS